MRTDRKSFLLRISPAVLAAVQRLATAELRSVNTEVEILLREALARRHVQLVDTDDAAVKPPR
jgi:hypothetical protein